MSEKKETQKESQKDMLFSKLLPALNNNPFSTSYNGQAPAPPTAPMAPVDDDCQDVLSALRSRLFARPNVYQSDSTATINIMESMVLKYIDQVIARFNTCSCDRCKCDIATHALNHLPPKYIVADPKNIMLTEEEIPTKVIMDALVNAAIAVRAKPKH